MLREQLIQQVQNQDIAIINDGTFDELKEVLKWCFPNANYSWENGGNKFYYSIDGVNYSSSMFNFISDKANSVKDFYFK